MLNIQEIETHFKNMQKLLSNLADPQEFEMVFSLIKEIKRLDKETDRLTMLNRHYCYKFYGGDIDKMKADCAYLFEQ